MHTSPLAAETRLDALVLHPWVPAALIALPLAAVRFLVHGCIQWAAALAYYTLIGLVPLMAAVFAAIKSLGLHRQLTPFVMNTIGAGSHEVTREVVKFIDATNVRAVLVLAALGALLAAAGIFTNAELCLNHIWGDVPGRSWRRKLGSLAKVAVLAPLLLVAALAVTAILKPGQTTYEFLDSWRLGEVVLALLRILPYALLWIGFTLLYSGVPNIDVSTRSAVFGAVVAGTLWQVAQWAYVSFVIKVVRYSAVYGALWQLPILLAWVYIAWCVVLYGAEVTRAHQEATVRRLERRRAEQPAPAAPAAE